MTQPNPNVPAHQGAETGIPTPRYTVTVGGQPIEVHGARSCRSPWPFRCFKDGEHPKLRKPSPDAPGGVAQVGPAGNAPYAFAGFTVTAPATVTVTSPAPLGRVRVRPANAAAVQAIEGDTITLRIDGPTKLSIEPDGRHGGLLLFADPPEADRPNPDSPKVRYYGPGVHRAGVIELHDDETLYLARGAIVEGGVRADGAKNVRVMGRGILCGDPWGWREGPQPHMLMFNDCENLLVEGITIRCSWQWTLRPFASRRVTIRNVKLCCGKNLNDDGIDPCSTSDVLIEDCFVRTHDDCISIKGHCPDRRNGERIEVRNCLFWSDLSRVLMVGPESHCERIGDIHLHDCEVLYLGPPIRQAGFGDWDGAAPAFCFEAGEDCRMEDIRIENVTVSVLPERDGKDVILIEPTVNQFMKRRTMGTLRNLTFTRVAFVGDTPCTPAIRVWGKDPQHTVEGVHFEKCTVFGRPLGGDYTGLTIGEHTDRITFEP